MTTHKFGYTEERLQTRIFEGMKEKQENPEKLVRSKQQKMEKDLGELNIKIDNATRNSLNKNNKLIKVSQKYIYWRENKMKE